MGACIIYEAGLTNPNREGLNEDAVFSMLRKGIYRHGAGGERSAFTLTKHFMECDRKRRFLSKKLQKLFVKKNFFFSPKTDHPIFPKQYRNCSDLNDFLRCGRRALVDCSDENKKKYEKEYLEYKKDKKETDDKDEDEDDDDQNDKIRSLDELEALDELQ